jgi:AcrR family transcriptional regulator
MNSIVPRQGHGEENGAAPYNGAATYTAKSTATRTTLVRAAERLFAEKGIEAVSLNEVSRAAHQRHSNACQYHFDNKEGLIQAIIDKHVPGIAARRNAMFDRMESDGASSLEDVIGAFVRPVAAKLRDPDGGKDFIRFNAQMIVPNMLAPRHLGPFLFTVPEMGRLAEKLGLAMEPQALPPAVISQRLMMAAIMLFQGLADYSRIEDVSPEWGDEALEIFIGEIETMMLAALTAPFRRKP